MAPLPVTRQFSGGQQGGSPFAWTNAVGIAAGTLVVIAVANSGILGACTSLTDSKGNTWTLQRRGDGSTQDNISLFTSVLSFALDAATTFTTAGGSGSGSWWAFWTGEISGTKTTSFLAGTPTSGEGGSGTTPNISFANSGAGDLIIGPLCVNSIGAGSMTVQSGWTSLSSVAFGNSINAGIGLGVQWRLAGGTPTSVAPTWTGNPGWNQGAIGILAAPSAAGGGSRIFNGAFGGNFDNRFIPPFTG